MLAPEPYLSACLEVLYRAANHARLLGWDGAKHGLTAEQCQEVADLMDAVHEIPHLLRHWESCDEPLLREILGGFDDKWKAKHTTRLLPAYEQVLAGDVTR